MSITIDVTVPEGEFYYLAGPMTGYPQHNFPEFERVAARLGEAGMNICSPADLDQPIYDEVMAGDGNQVHLRSDSELGRDLLRRDVNIVMHPRCVGVIVLKGWHESRGALIETFIGDRFGRNIYAYDEDATGKFYLVMIDRDSALLHFEAKKRLDLMQEAPPLTVPADRPSAGYGRLELDPLGESRARRILDHVGPGLDIPRGRRAV